MVHSGAIKYIIVCKRKIKSFIAAIRNDNNWKLFKRKSEKVINLIRRFISDLNDHSKNAANSFYYNNLSIAYA